MTAEVRSMVLKERSISMLPTRIARQSNGDPIEAFHREFDTALGRFFGGGDGGTTRWAPFGVDVREDADHIYVEAELPGFKKDDIDITLENQTLSISAERKEEQEKKGDYLLNERRYQRFRSEERRVGKECRRRCGQEDGK